jgi:hypothetical protein
MKKKSKKLDKDIIKRHLIDIISILALALFIPILVINKPDIRYNEQSARKHIPQAEKKAKGKDVEKVTRTERFNNIVQRNIFSPDGAYITPKGKGPLPLTENPYRLIGVLTSGLKRAVIVDYAGEVFILKEKGRLDDGSVISRIGNTYVTLKRGKKERELKIFDIGGKRN